MQNLQTLKSVKLPVKLPICPQLPVITTTPTIKLHTIHRSDTSTLTLTSHTLPPNAACEKKKITIPIHTTEPTSPTSLVPLQHPTEDTILLTLRSGEVYAIKPSIKSAIVLADVKHHEQNELHKSGVLSSSISPDGHIFAIISPTSLSLLDSCGFSTLAHFNLPCIASHASMVWRSDNEYLCFIVRDYEDDGCIRGFVVDRLCEHVVNLDIDRKLSKQLAVVIDWQPRPGGFICISGPDEHITFFERNGQRQRRLDFQIAGNGTPKLIRWNKDCKYLVVVVEENDDQGEGDGWRLNIYTQMNYKWYCKKQIITQHRILNIHWDDDDPYLLYVITEKDILNFKFHTLPSIVSINDTCAIGTVVDGKDVLLTEFKSAVVPPPLAHAAIKCNEDVSGLCVMRRGEGIGMLTVDGCFEWCLFDEDVMNSISNNRVSYSPAPLTKCTRGKRKLFVSSLLGLDDPDSGCMATGAAFMRLPVMSSKNCLVIVAPETQWKDSEANPPGDALFMFPFNNSSNGGDNDLKEVSRMLVSDGGNSCRVNAIGHSSEEMSIVVVTSNGILMRILVDEYSKRFVEFARVINVSTTVIEVYEVRTGRGRALTFLLDTNGNLDVVELASTRRLSVSKECTSFCIHEGFLIFTSKSHLLYCVLMDTKTCMSNYMNKEAIPSVIDSLDSAEEFPCLKQGHGATRPIDRGSLIVTPLVGKTDVILQAPRGNLETISPRPIVFEVVDRLSKSREYWKAFELSRRQRVDMNHIVNANFDGFIANIENFVHQVDDPNHLSIFMTFLNGDTDKINQVCHSIVQQLLSDTGNVLKYTPAILTGLIKKQPCDYEGALRQVENVRKCNIDDGSSAMDFLFVLVKNEKLVYEYALGMYDLNLAAFVAECSQMDPAEYIKELHGLRNLQDSNENEKMYQIDMRLKRYSKALKHLFACGECKYRECISLCHEHGLYETGLSLFNDHKDIRIDLLKGYGIHLRDNENKYEGAAAAFTSIELWKHAAECYRMERKWEMAIYCIGKCVDLSDGEKKEIYGDIADELADSGMHVASARIRASVVGDIEGALEVLCNADEWDTAFEIVNTSQLIMIGLNEENKESINGHRETIKRFVIEGYETLKTMLKENNSKLKERGHRYNILKELSDKLKGGMTSNANNTNNNCNNNNNNNNNEDDESDVFSATSASSIGSNLSDVTFTSKTSTSATSLYSSITHSQAGPLSSAKLDKQAQRRKHRASKKRIREGHPNEREYLITYLRKLIPRQFVRTRVENMIRALVFIGAIHQAVIIADEMMDLVEIALSLPDDVVDNDVREELTSERSWLVDTKCFRVVAGGSGGSFHRSDGTEVSSMNAVAGGGHDNDVEMS